MRVEYTVPLPEISDASEGKYAHHFNDFLDAAVDFALTRPVFTPHELHEYLLRHFIISDEPQEFWETLGSIRQAMLAVCDARNLDWTWHEESGDYETSLYGLDVVRPEESLVGTDNLTDMQLTDHVRHELMALFRGRRFLSEQEILFYLHHIQQFQEEAPAILQQLVADDFLWLAEEGTYALGRGPQPPASPRPAARTTPAALRRPPGRPPKEDQEDQFVIFLPASRPVLEGTVTRVVEGVTFRVPAEREGLVGVQDLPHLPTRQPEVSPQVPDAPFAIEDLHRAQLILNRLAWQSARLGGVPVSHLIGIANDGTTPVPHLRSIVGRLWRRGYLLRDTSNPHDSIMRLRPDLPETPEEWQMALAGIMHDLMQPYQPPTHTT